jgi:hypothetical protein
MLGGVPSVQLPTSNFNIVVAAANAVVAQWCAQQQPVLLELYFRLRCVRGRVL